MAERSRRQAFGQHFLRDSKIIQSIRDEALRSTLGLGIKNLIEIGPGKGAITLELAQKIENEKLPIQLTLIEMDRKFSAFWRDQKRTSIKAVIDQDFLKVPLEPIFGNEPTAIVSNLPYASGTAILAKCLSQPYKLQALTLMFQAEVAQRLYAVPSTKAWGSLSLFVQNHWEVKKLLHVPPGAFTPPPKVDSEVVTLSRRVTPLIKISDPKIWDTFVKTAFGQRRKMLRSVLNQAPTPELKERFKNALVQACVDPTLRAEALTWSHWQQLADALSLA